MAARLCQEVVQITRGQVQLSMYCRETAGPSPQQSPPIGTTSFPVQFHDLNYGTLCVQHDPARPTQPIIPSVTVYLLTQICGYILHALEVSAFFQLQYRHLESQAVEPLTRREREVLNLLCCGYDEWAIGQTLNIAPSTVDSHRQHIYAKLQVHNRQEMLLTAFRTRLFSPLEGV
ncbi:MAG: helix-turn-helix transcriptional regulator [Ktedonobacteraceae bacterium]